MSWHYHVPGGGIVGGSGGSSWSEFPLCHRDVNACLAEFYREQDAAKKATK